MKAALVACALAACGLAAAAAVGCASVIGIPDATPSFCASNPGHDYCEDFDVGDASTRWTFAETTGGATITLAPSDRSPPNLLDMSTPGQGVTGSGLAGFDKEFDDATFNGVHVEADVRFVTQNGAPVDANGGFLLVVDKSGGCIGIGLGGAPGGPNGIGVLIYPEATACSALTGSRPAGTSAPATGTLTQTPPPNQWFHVTLIVTPDASGDGSGVLTFNIQGQPGSIPTVAIPSGTLVSTGIPLVGFASEVNGIEPLEVQFDNVTVDLTGN